MLAKRFVRYPGIVNEKTTIKEFAEIYEQIRKEEIYFNDEKEIIDSNYGLLTNFYWEIRSKTSN